MTPSNLLLASILVPAFGAILIASIGSVSVRLVRGLCLIVTGLTLLLAVMVVLAFDTSGDEEMLKQLVMATQNAAVMSPISQTDTAFAVTQYSWLPARTGLDVRFAVGLDGLSLWLYALSAILMPTCVLLSWSSVQRQPALFYAMLLVLESGCLGVFAARDIILFYVFFEFTLIPLFFLIGVWGSEQRQYAAKKFFLFTLVGSLLTFLGLLTIVLWAHKADTYLISCSIPELVIRLTRDPMPTDIQIWVFLALFAGFAIKVPLFPLHTWLPLAHVQAPAAGSVFLAGILLKIGTYAFLRFSIPLLPMATSIAVPWMMWLSVIGIIYGALVALAQADIKRLVAYSSISHLGFCMLGLFALNPLGVQGATLQMINHGISTGALFALIGMLYERFHTRQITLLGGLASRLPVLAFFMLLFTFSSIGLPGLNGFTGEVMILAGAFQRAWGQTSGPWTFQLRLISVLAVGGVVLGAWYMLWLVQRVLFGPYREPGETVAAGRRDLCAREILALAPLAILVFWIGIYPKFFLDRMQPCLQYSIMAASEAQDGTAPAKVLISSLEDHEKNDSAH